MSYFGSMKPLYNEKVNSKDTSFENYYASKYSYL